MRHIYHALLNLHFRLGPQGIHLHRHEVIARRHLVCVESLDKSLAPVGVLVGEVGVWQLVKLPDALFDKLASVHCEHIYDPDEFSLLQVKNEVSKSIKCKN